MFSCFHYTSSSAPTLMPAPPPSKSLSPDPLLISSLEKRLGLTPPPLSASSFYPPNLPPLRIRLALRLITTVSDSEHSLAAHLTDSQLASNQCLDGLPRLSARWDAPAPQGLLCSTFAAVSTWKLGGKGGGGRIGRRRLHQR